MRWDELFADLEGQLEHELAAEGRSIAGEDERMRRGRLTLGDRLAEMARSGPVRLLLADAQVLELRIESTGADWIAGQARHGARDRGVVVPIASVDAVLPSADQLRCGASAAPAHPTDLGRRLGIAFVLRDLARRRRVVELRTRSALHRGSIGSVGADHLDFLEYEGEDARMRRGTERTRVVPFASIHSVWT